MPGHLPGKLGIAAFAGVKFAGYTLAGVVLRRVYHATKASALTIAATRTLAGIVIGISHFLLVGSFLGTQQDRVGLEIFVLDMLVLRFILWTAIIWFFCDRRWEHPRRTLASAVGGTALSFLLDVMGIALAFVTPGQVPFC